LGDGKDENFEKSKNAIKSGGRYGVSIELIVCLKYSPKVPFELIVYKTCARGNPLSYPHLQEERSVRFFKSLIPRLG